MRDQLCINSNQTEKTYDVERRTWDVGKDGYVSSITSPLTLTRSPLGEETVPSSPLGGWTMRALSPQPQLNLNTPTNTILNTVHHQKKSNKYERVALSEERTKNLHVVPQTQNKVISHGDSSAYSLMTHRTMVFDTRCINTSWIKHVPRPTFHLRFQ